MDRAASWELVNSEVDVESPARCTRARAPVLKYGAVSFVAALLVVALAKAGSAVVAGRSSSRSTEASVDEDVSFHSNPEYYLGEFGVACDSEAGVIDSVEECTDAAEQLNLPTGQKRFQRKRGDSPFGCMLWASEVYLNTAEPTTFPFMASPICKRTGGPAPGPAPGPDSDPEYYLGELGVACDSGASVIDSVEECADAAELLGLPTGEKRFERKRGDSPFGCMQWSTDSRVYLNTATPTKLSKERPICRGGGGPGPAPGPGPGPSPVPSDELYPQGLLQCPDGAVMKTACPSSESEKVGLYNEIVSKVVDIYDRLSSTCVSTECPQADFAGCLVRFAGHDLMDFDGRTGGSDGCIKFEDEDNKGLQVCLLQVQGAYHGFCSRVSLADFVVVAAEALMMRSRRDWDGQKSPSLRMDEGFQFGRQTRAECATNGPLPSGMQSSSETNS